MCCVLHCILIASLQGFKGEHIISTEVFTCHLLILFLRFLFRNRECTNLLLAQMANLVKANLLKFSTAMNKMLVLVIFPLHSLNIYGNIVSCLTKR